MTVLAAPGRWNLESARDIAVRHVEDGSLPCLVFGVVDGDGASQVVAVNGPGTMARDDSVFFLASVTKAIVATAVMQYVDEGRLDLRAPLARYLPEMTGDGRESVSAWHLLTHTSGLPDMPLERIRSERPTYRSMLRRTFESRPGWPPGSRYEYNSSAWVLLAELMARLSSVPFPEVLEMRLLRPLAMADTTFDGRRLRERIVPIEGVNAERRVVQEMLLWLLARARMPGGGMFGSVPDLLRLGRSLLPTAGHDTVRPLSRASVAMMAEPQTDGIPVIESDGSSGEVRQGLGWRKSAGPWPPGESVITHGGVSGTRLWVDPEADLAFAFLTNRWAATSEVAVAVLDAIYRAR
jgi:CubicO group peptidase (beta-lactamase class C family)